MHMPTPPIPLAAALAATALLYLTACDSDDESGAPTTPPTEEVVAVANRAGGSVTFFDAVDDVSLGTLEIAGAEPMYVVYVPATDRLYLGDRAQDLVHVIDPDTRAVEAAIPVGEGVFHMWADGRGERLWVNNDVDNTTSVIDLAANAVVATVEVGVKPHDVFADASGTTAYVSVRAGDEAVADSVFAYSASTFERLAARAVGEDPHLYHLPADNRVYVPNQSGQLLALDGADLAEVDRLDVPGAHGIYPSPDGRFLFVTNLPGGELYGVDARDLTLVGDPLASPIPIPHNVAVNAAGTKAYVTHSGASADQVTVYDVSGGALALSDSLTAGGNPFGLAYYRRTGR